MHIWSGSGDGVSTVAWFIIYYHVSARPQEPEDRIKFLKWIREAPSQLWVGDMMRDIKNATVYREMMEMMINQWIPGEGYHVCYECHSLRLPVV